MGRKDKNALMKMNSASNHSSTDRDENDFYATPTRMVGELLNHENFCSTIWEPCNGMGHISNYFSNKDYEVIKSDIIDRTGDNHILDFLKFEPNYVHVMSYYVPQPIYDLIHFGDYQNNIACDIITNPPYGKGNEFYEHACSIIDEGHKVAMFVKIQFLETQKRYELFKQYPPKKVLICVNRVHCGKGGKFNNEDASGGAACYCWLIYEKGYYGPCTIDWINFK